MTDENLEGSPVTDSKETKRIKERFGNRLRDCRESAGYVDAAELACALGIKAGAYRKYERGESWPPPHIQLQLMELLNQNADYLFFGRTQIYR